MHNSTYTKSLKTKVIYVILPVLGIVFLLIDVLLMILSLNGIYRIITVTYSILMSAGIVAIVVSRRSNNR